MSTYKNQREPPNPAGLPIVLTDQRVLNAINIHSARHGCAGCHCFMKVYFCNSEVYKNDTKQGASKWFSFWFSSGGQGGKQRVAIRGMKLRRWSARNSKPSLHCLIKRHTHVAALVKPTFTHCFYFYTSPYACCHLHAYMHNYSHPQLHTLDQRKGSHVYCPCRHVQLCSHPWLRGKSMAITAVLWLMHGYSKQIKKSCVNC